MSALFLSLLWKLWPVILAVGGGLLWGLKQRRAGATKERAKHEAADRLVRDIADEVENEIGALTPLQRREKLSRDWAKK